MHSMERQPIASRRLPSAPELAGNAMDTEQQGVEAALDSKEEAASWGEEQ